MAAAATQFKLSKQGGLTRRLAFSDRPSWAILSSKIGAMYAIATDNVGVSYIDQDGDDVTLSSEEELQDYYNTLYDHRVTIKLAVQDLSSLRSTYFTPTRPNTTSTPQQSHFRNTFGEAELLPFVFEFDDEWERLPRSVGGLFGSNDTPESPHAFVEVLDSDVSFSKKTDNADEESSAGDTTHSDATFTMHTRHTDKGKARIDTRPTVEDDISSTDSVFGDDSPPKPQVHVYDCHSDEASIFGGKVKSAVSVSGTATPAQAQSTPVISGQVLSENVSHFTEDSNAAIDDPALPTLDSSTTSSTSTSSLTHDIADFLTTFSGIISSHPELSEGIRNIVNNATNGAYWAAHREALSRAVDNIQQETGRTAEEIRRVEEEAGVRVADALGGVFRAFGVAVQAARNTTESFQPPAAQDRPRAPEPAPEPVHPFYPCDFPLLARPPLPPPPPPPGHVPHPPLHHWGLPHGRRHGWPRPPPPFWGAPPPVDRREEVATHVDRHADTVRTRTSDIRTTLAEARNRRLGQANPTNVLPSAPVQPPAPSAPSASAVPPPPILQNSSPFETTPPTQEELRADVERAKADYKMRKERYRQAKAIKKMAEQREQTRQDTSGSINVSGLTEPTLSGAEAPASQAPPVEAPVPEHVLVPPSPAPAGGPPVSRPATPIEPQVHIVSNARGPYPQLEMFSVPRRSHTIGHSQRRGLGLHEERETRSMQRIMRKLSEMGFTEGTCPKLNVKVTEQILANPPITKDAEDDIVTNLIEELIPSKPAHPRASSSREPIPGAWA
ncbi:putative protein 10 [Rhizopogon vesiculosus]|uniref:PB1 domain-containing protein n=1 Tax=Rhizopogon vesiculosus TaxID=180088 RepID=A0A1J8RCT0_9AGAM|nr:putative protein 10 [Rhizopogon vesiculosus]